MPYYVWVVNGAILFVICVAIWWVGIRRTPGASLYSGFFLIGIGLVSSILVPVLLGVADDRSVGYKKIEHDVLVNLFIVVASVGASFVAGGPLAMLGQVGVGRLFGLAFVKSRVPRLVALDRKLNIDARYARLNWRAHLLPLADAGHAAFTQQLTTLGLRGVVMSVLSRDAAKGLISPLQEALWTDSVEFFFGNRPVPVEPVVPVPNCLTLLKERSASLLFAQSLSGHVIALIFLPCTDNIEKRERFLVGSWENPNQIRMRDIDACLNLAMKVDVMCCTSVFPNKAAARLLATLRARDQEVQSGGSWLRAPFK